MVTLEAMRAAIEGDNLSGYDVTTQSGLALGISAIDKALQDADALIVSYGIPPNVSSSALTRIACTLAMYYLQGAERLQKEDAIAYDGAVKLLTQHARGEVTLAAPSSTSNGSLPVGVDFAVVDSSARRYRGGADANWESGS
jgi:phage gp36-like protein